MLIRTFIVSLIAYGIIFQNGCASQDEETRNPCTLITIRPGVSQLLTAMARKISRQTAPLQPTVTLNEVTDILTDLTSNIEEFEESVYAALAEETNSSIMTNSELSSKLVMDSESLLTEMINVSNTTNQIINDIAKIDNKTREMLAESTSMETERARLVEEILEQVSNLSVVVEQQEQEPSPTTDFDEAETQINELMSKETSQSDLIEQIVSEFAITDDIVSQEILARATLGELRRRHRELSWKHRQLKQEHAALKIAVEYDTASPYRAVDCSDHFRAGHRISGVFTIFPSRCSDVIHGVDVWCEMGESSTARVPFSGGGWTVILTRDNKYYRDDQNERTLNESLKKLEEHILLSLNTTDSSIADLEFSSAQYNSTGNIEENRTFENRTDEEWTPEIKLEDIDDPRREKIVTLTSKVVNFTRPWNEYLNGFGNVTGEYFIGLTSLHQLMNSRRYSLYIVAEWKAGNVIYGQWNKIHVAGEEDNYRLRVSKYWSNSTMPDVMSAHSNQMFSTVDRDNDASYLQSCAQRFGGGWWFKRCYDIHPTGEWSADQASHRGVLVGGWGRQSGLLGVPVANLKMMLLPRHFNNINE